ncbi:hypothetical protein ABMA28_016558 [Loxostege sticticalis]|uniref:Uncharacterized protein n=1 Tax=Loxostege sticticalis TaxID=481309 RepID=A0ABD0T980_LOXSC
MADRLPAAAFVMVHNNKFSAVSGGNNDSSLPLMGGLALGAGFLAQLYYFGPGEPKREKASLVERKASTRYYCDRPNRRKWPIDE